jgi:dienelactone hydrolase
MEETAMDRLRAFPGKVDTGFPKGNATTLESRALSGHDPSDLTINLIGKRSRTLTVVLALSVAAGAAALGEQVSFPPMGPARTPDAMVPVAIPGTLSLPEAVRGKAPAVVIAHASGGVMADGPELDYVAALNAAGIATLVIDMWTPRGVPTGPAAFGGEGGLDRRPRSVGDTLPDAFGALEFLAARPAIDPKRIGIMGFSWGAMLSVLTMSEDAAERALGADLRFAAHSAHDFVCSLFLPGAPAAPAVATKWTNAPLQLQVGGQDDYDNADGGAACRTLIETLPPDKQGVVELIVYRDSTHMWEQKLPFPIMIHDPRRGSVHIATDAEASALAKASTVAFFKTAFGM